MFDQLNVSLCTLDLFSFGPLGSAVHSQQHLHSSSGSSPEVSPFDANSQLVYFERLIAISKNCRDEIVC